MEYTCLKSLKGEGKAFVLIRKPQVAKDDIEVYFQNAPERTTAIFYKNDDNSIYRELKDGACKVPMAWLEGEIEVSLYVLHESGRSEKYNCEPFYAESIEGGVLIYPNWLDIQEQIIDLHKDIKVLTDEQIKLTEKQSALEDKVTKLLEGYNFV
jgi:hypothetical protein